MAKFRANTDDAYILTNIQNQESGDSDWAKYQVTTKDKSRLPLHNGTTNDLLKVFKDTTQAHDIFGDSSAIATYPFDGNANDLGGNYNGTWHGTEQYDTGMFGQAAKFDGSSWISCPYISSFNGNVEWTFSLFYKVISISNSQIFWFGDNGAYGALNISVSDNKIDCRIIGSNIYSVDIDNSWHHIAVINTTSQVKYYHDGELIDVDNINVNIGNGNKGDWFTIASVYGESEYGYFNGLIDQVRIFNRVLTEDEIAFLYHEDLTHIRKHDQLIIYNATDGAKIHEVTSITDNDTDKTYDIDISSLSLTEVPTNVHQLTKSVDLTDKIDTSNTTATTLVLQDALENSTLVKNGETLVIDGYKLENINVTRSLDGGNVKYSIDISSLNHVPSEVILIKPRVEISVGDEDKANADDLVLDVLGSTTTSVTVGYYDGSKRARIKNAERVDTDTGLDLPLIEVVEEYLDPTKVDPFNDNSEVAFYQLDGNANDAHNQYNGTWHSTEQYDTGVFGQAAKFNGSSYIILNNNPFQIFNNKGTISVWIKNFSFSNAFFVIIGSDNPGSNKGRQLRINNGVIELYFFDCSEKITAQLPNSDLIHIIGIKETNIQKLFVNGNLCSTNNITDTSTTFSKSYIGATEESGSLNYFFKGLIDQVRIFNRALAEDEVKYLYNEGKYKFNLNLQSEQSSAPTKAIIRPTIQDILELDPNNTTYDNTNDLVNVHYQPVQKGNGFRSVQVKWNAHRQGDENNSLRVNLWKKVA